jgi:tetratricopeptide (TPR) repeat protein
MSRILIVALLAGAPAHAGGTAKEQAEVLFREGRELLLAGKNAEACVRFEKSQAVDRALGTLLNLADCHESMGKTATALSDFQEAARWGESTGQKERSKVAKQRVEALMRRVPHLKVVAPAGLADLQVALDQAPLATQSLGVELAVDPGEHTLEATAPGRRAWKTTIQLPAEPKSVTVEIPELDSEMVAETNPVATGPASVAAAAPGVSQAPPQTAPGMTKGRVASYVLLGTGAVGLAVGIGLGVNAKTLWGAAQPNCVDRTCDATGFKMATDAKQSANAASVAIAIGSTLAIGGGVLWILTRPSSSVRITPAIGPGAVGLQGEF